MRVERFFSAAELEEIERSTREAEARTSGEIVPVVVEAADAYDEAVWKGTALGALAAALAAGLVHLAGGFWGGQGVLWITLPTAGGAALGFVLTQLVPWLRRGLAADEILELRVGRRARQAFLEEEVFATRRRSGILIFVALFERRVVLLGDAGINRVVDPSEWQEIVAHLVAGINAGRPGAALSDAIRACGELLERHGVEIEADDRNELTDGLRMEDR